MEIFNMRSLTQKQRFNTALISGIMAAVVLGIATGFIRRFINLSIIIWLVGFGVAWVIRKMGRGVQVKFSVLAGIYALVGVLLSDVVFLFGFSGILVPSAYLTVISYFLNQGVTSMIWLLYRVVAIYIAYNYSRVF